MVQPLIEKYRSDKRKESHAQFQQAVSQRKFASTIGEVWQPAYEGRGDRLLVEDEIHSPARLGEDGVLVRADDLTAPDMIDTGLNKQGKVIFVGTANWKNIDTSR